MAIHYVKKEDIHLTFNNGYAQTELLPGSYNGGVRAFRCILKTGATVSPEILHNSLQILCLTSGKGAVLTKEKVYAINEPAIYAADPFDTFSIHAATDMTFTMFVVEQKPGDVERYDSFHLLLPFFCPLSQGVEYVQSCKTTYSRSFSLIPTKRLCRILMGYCTADGTINNSVEGTIEKGHPAVAQWNVTFGDTNLTLTVNGESVDIQTDDFSYVPAGLDHSLTTKPGSKLGYIWFEHYVLEKDYLVSFPKA
jgi:mannose-6-phosphate isomerase-like protein (cupin superfamily)